jgi:fatty acid desaturase
MPRKDASRKGSPTPSSSGSEDSTVAGSPTPLSRSSSGNSLKQQPIVTVYPQEKCDPDLWYIHGKSYDLSAFVPKHPGGQLAVLSGRGRDCTALFESYHPWNDKHRKVLAAYGPAAPPPDPFYEEIKVKVREAYPEGPKETKMRWRTIFGLYSLWCLSIYLFFFHRTPLAAAGAGFIMATVGTRLAHEGGHYQLSHKEWANRLSLFLGYFLTGPSMAWHYRHVISHHAHTNMEEDVDVQYIWMADMLPGWLKVLTLPGVFAGALFEIGPKSIFDMVVLRSVGGHRVDWRIGMLLPEIAVWILVHWFAGPSWMCYAVMWFVAGIVFVPCSQVAHAILYPDNAKYTSWAKLQIAESCDFATDSDFWYHMAFGLTTQVEHHLFPGIGHHCYDRIRLLTREVCARHGVHHYDISASKAFGALWHRWVKGCPKPLA